MKRLFGTDGVRGVAGEFPLDDRTIGIIGASLARQLRERTGKSPRIVTGRDTRESGEQIEAAFHAGAKSEGAECVSAAVITTPGVAYLTRTHGFDAGVVISASHNPFEDNGIKIFTPTGKKADDETERAIEADIASGGVSEFAATEVDRSKAEQFNQDYIGNLAAGFPELDLSGKKILIDCANGAACHLAPELFRRFGADVTAINDAPDGRNINRDCGSLHLEHLQRAVIDQKADFGVAYDGDADRALFVNEKGEIVDGDATLWIMANFLLDHGKLANRKVIATVMSNIGLELALKSRGIELVRTAVGDKYVLDELLSSGSEIGGEQSGHIIFPDKSIVGDGMLTTLFVLEAMHERGAGFSQLLQGFTTYPQILVNVKVREKRPFEEVAAIADSAKAIEGELAGTGRLLLRYSGTENLARVMIEGKDQSTITDQANRLAEVIRTSLN
jgi:phosphoglucosamine mutase